MARGVDFTEFQQFADNWRDGAATFNAFLTTFLLEQAERLLGKTKPRTPVGTPESTGIPGYLGGSLREAWQIGEITGSGTELQVEILNGMDYATFIEYGWTSSLGKVYEPRYMLNISLDEIYAQMPLRFEADFNSFLVRMGMA